MSIVSRTIGFGQRPALLVIDLAYGFTDPAEPLGSDVDAVVEASLTLRDEARAAAVPVLFTTVAYDAPDLSDAGVWGLKVDASMLRAGTRAVAIDDRLGRRPEEPVVVKRYASSFFGSDLLPRLVAGGVDTLVICGVSTSGCVRATTVDAIQHGFRPIVVREAVGDRSPEAHRQSLADLGQKYADVISLAEAVAGLRAAAG